MLETGLPQWMRLQINDMVRGYQLTMAMCERRCIDLMQAGRRNDIRQFCDDLGTIDEYRMDAKYCAGQITRLRAAMEGRLTPEEQEKGPWQEIPRNPKHLADWAWNRLADEPTSQPDPEVKPPRQLHLHEVLADFNPRERQVLIHCFGAKWTPEATAEKLGIPVHLVKRYLNNARAKFKENEKLRQESV